MAKPVKELTPEAVAQINDVIRQGGYFQIEGPIQNEDFEDTNEHDTFQVVFDITRFFAEEPWMEEGGGAATSEDLPKAVDKAFKQFEAQVRKWKSDGKGFEPYPWKVS